ECHLMSADSANPLQVKPVAIHPVWFANAKFSHFTHQAVNCQACHAEAYPQELPAEPSAVQTLDNDKTFIPGRTLCLQCHSPPKNVGETATGGARFDCVECHDYHDGDKPWHTLGGEYHGVKERMSIQYFIEGRYPR